MVLRIAEEKEFETIQSFYWDLIDLMKNHTDSVGWKKNIYPSNEFLLESLRQKELYVYEDKACVILNNACNESYEGISWSISCDPKDVLIPHALAVFPTFHQQGIGKKVIQEIIEFAKNNGKKTIRLDILDGNIAAEKLYTSCGFWYVVTKKMYYEDTGWTNFSMYEYIL